MGSFWIKNKWTVLSVIIFTLSVGLFSDMSILPTITLISSFLSIPLIFNMKIDSGSIWYNILGGFLFGLLVSSANFNLVDKSHESILPFPHSTQILYWFLILTLNWFFVQHRSEYMKRKKIADYQKILGDCSESRDNKIDGLVNPIKRKFFQ